jgi:segregation and condensation protein B
MSTTADHTELRRTLEAVLMVAEEPTESRLLGELCEVAPSIVQELLAEMAAAYESEGRGFVLVEVAGGWRFQSHEAQSAYVERFVLTGQSARLSAAALETLAIVAYKQPISRAQIASIRGVNVDGVIRTLTQRGYIAEIGQDPGPGQASLFGTTGSFLERIGLNDLDQLPSLGDFIPEADVVELLEHGLRLDADEAEDARDPEDAGDADEAPGIRGAPQTQADPEAEGLRDTEVARDAANVGGPESAGSPGGAGSPGDTGRADEVGSPDEVGSSDEAESLTAIPEPGSGSNPEPSSHHDQDPRHYAVALPVPPESETDLVVDVSDGLVDSDVSVDDPALGALDTVD